MKRTIRHIRNLLDPYYPSTEIEGFTAILFQHFLAYSTTDMVLNSHKVIEKNVFQQIEAVVKRLISGEPIQYILGEASFYGLQLKVNPTVLIPRSETEELVDHIVKQHQHKTLSMLDIGTGSGAIPIAIKKNIPLAEVYACDISEGALQTAQENALFNQADIQFFKHDILSELPLPVGKLDLMVSNPPYVTEKEKEQMLGNVLNHEPHLALFVPNNDPLLFYRAIALKAKQSLKKGGELWFEINESFGQEMLRLMHTLGFAATILKDLNEKDRIIKSVYCD